MTNHWNDIANADVVLGIGANPAENHPAAFGHITDALARGATLICVDPRFTRTAARAQLYAPIRSGTDIAFVGGMIKYVLDDITANPANYNLSYIENYTDALLKVAATFQGPADTGTGLFSGYNGAQNETDNAKRSYATGTWAYDDANADKIPDIAANRNDLACVFQVLKKHFNRYDADTVCKITGTPKDVFLKVCQTYAATGARGKAGTILYAMGTTQHTYGSQIVRIYAILQLLLANIGVCGGGVNAMRGESNVQGCTDMFLAHILPGYIGVPTRVNTTLGVDPTKLPLGIIYNQNDADAAFLALPANDAAKDKTTSTAPADMTQAKAKNSFLWARTRQNWDALSINWWKNTPKYVVSLLKAWYGDNATLANDFCYQYLPKVVSPANHMHIALFEAMYAGSIKGLMCWGQNPAVAGPNSLKERAALEKLEWLVCVDLWQTETANFWQRPGVTPSTINTEVFMLPAAASFEKEGSVTNSSRWMQWRYVALNPPGQAEPDLWMINKIMTKVRELYAAEGGKLAAAIAALNWNYGADADSKQVAKELNGYYLAPHASAGKLVPGFANLLFNGQTSCGCWVYCDSWVEEANLDAFEKAHVDQMFPGPEYVGSRAARRWPVDVGNRGYSAADGYRQVGLYSYWSWCWPYNRRIVYNRAGVDPWGKPWDAEHPVMSWNATTQLWDGDVGDGTAKPMWDGLAAATANGTPPVAGSCYPFIMQEEGRGRLFAREGKSMMVDGPIPEHYEPWESPVSNPMSGQQSDPCFKLFPSDDASMNKKGDAATYPIVCTTYRMVEHWQAGQMTRNLPWVVEMQPGPFAEMSEELAAEKGIANGDQVVVESARGSVRVVAMVTKRFKPFAINGATVHQIGIPWHWGYTGLSKGDSANVLTPHVGDANTQIPEFKAFLCKVRKA